MRPKKTYLVENYPIINGILEKLHEFGYQNLENDEKIILNKYSEWLNSGKKGDFEEIINPKTIDLSQKEGDKFSINLSDGSEFTYQYDYSDEEPNQDIYYGSVYWQGEEWVGLFATDKKDSVTEIDFFKLDNEEFERTGSNDIRLQDELGKQIYQVRLFFEDEVLPHLMN